MIEIDPGEDRPNPLVSGNEINEGLEGAEARETDTSVRPRGRQQKQMRREQGSGVEQPK
jgi:hypothetical protein